MHGESALGQLPLAQQRDVKLGFGHIDAQTRLVRLTHAAILLAPASCPTSARSWAGDTRRHSCSSRLTAPDALRRGGASDTVRPSSTSSRGAGDLILAAASVRPRPGPGSPPPCPCPWLAPI